MRHVHVNACASVVRASRPGSCRHPAHSQSQPIPTIPDRTRGSTRCDRTGAAGEGVGPGGRCAGPRGSAGRSGGSVRGRAARVEADLERVLAARGAEAADVLAGHSGGAVLDAVAEEERVARAAAGCRRAARRRAPRCRGASGRVPCGSSPGVHRHALRGAARVAVVDGHVAVDAVLVGAHDVVRLAAGSSRRAPMCTRSWWPSVCSPPSSGESSSASSCSSTSEACHEGPVRAGRGPLGGRCARRARRAAGSGTPPAAAGSPPAPVRPAATRGAAGAGRPAASNSGL